MASAHIAPFFVAPKESASTPSSWLQAAGVHPKASIALANRAPSIWSLLHGACRYPKSRATLQACRPGSRPASRANGGGLRWRRTTPAPVIADPKASTLILALAFNGNKLRTTCIKLRRTAFVDVHVAFRMTINGVQRAVSLSRAPRRLPMTLSTSTRSPRQAHRKAHADPQRRVPSPHRHHMASRAHY